MTTRETVLTVAKQFLGMDEHRNRDILKAFLGVTPSATAWCAAFVNAVLRTAKIKGTGSFMARSFLNWGVTTDDPQPGDIVIFERGNNTINGHVGFFISHATNTRTGDKLIQVLGGNQSDSVNLSYYSASKLLGFRTYEET